MFPVAGEFHQFPLQCGDPVSDPAAVDLQFGFTRSPAADATHQAGHLDTPAGQAGQQVFELGQFYLYLAITAFGPSGKDIQNQLAAIQHLQLGHGGDAAYLSRCQLLVKDQQGGPPLQSPDHHLL